MNIRRYVLPSALILLLGLGVGIAQSINRAIQLSQDTSGSFGVDNFLGIYLPGHILSPLTPRPAPTVTGTGTPTIVGTDTAGVITMGTSAATATALFGTGYVSVPYCVASSNTAQATPISVVTTATTIAISQVVTSGNKISYICMSAS